MNWYITEIYLPHSHFNRHVTYWNAHTDSFKISRSTYVLTCIYLNSTVVKEKRSGWPFSRIISSDSESYRCKCHQCVHFSSKLSKYLSIFVLRVFFLSCVNLHREANFIVFSKPSISWVSFSHPTKFYLWKMYKFLKKRILMFLWTWRGKRFKSPIS